MNKNKTNTDELIKTIEQIPTIPIIANKIMGIIGDEDTSFKELVGLVEKDQALAVQLLKVANSAFYGLLSKVSSLEHALVVLGTKEVKSIVLGFSVHNFFSHNGDDTFDRTQFWKHSIICSQVAKLLGRRFRVRNDDTLFLAGLIHDMGKVIIDQYFHEEFLQIIDLVDTGDIPFSTAEKLILGTTHYQVAAKLLKQWQFPNKVIMEVLYHHAPWYDKNYEMSSIIIYLANILTKLSGYPCHPNENQIDLHNFVNSKAFDFIIKSGFDIDYETMKNLINHIQEFIFQEADNVMRVFEE